MSVRRFVGTTSPLFRLWVVLGAVVPAAVLLALLSPFKANAVATLPSGFQERIVLSGLIAPTNVEFSDDGRIFVAEKSGVIKVFDNLSDTTPTTFADLRTKVYNYSDRGLLGLTLDPNFPIDPYVYVLYTHDAPIDGTAPRWGDSCPDPPGGTGDGCVASSHLSRLQADVTTNKMTGPEQVLIEDWCQQYPSHSVGDLAFGPGGALYVSHGESASFNFTDYGQGGGSLGSPTPKNPCGDPPTGVGGTQTPPTAEGGSLRSQDLRTGGDPVTLDGAILRVNPATGAALPGNPLIGDPDLNARRIVAYGKRNPFRFTIRPGTNEVWVGDVGGGSREEIDRVSNPTGSVVRNFGWPCYEGTGRHPRWDASNLNICENLYTQANAVTAPYYSYTRSQELVAGETTAGCNAGATLSGLAFYTTGPYPDEYDDALFFGDYSRSCIWAMQKGADGLPKPTKLKTFVAGAATPVDLEISPDGDLYYVDIGGGTLRRIQYSGVNHLPIARATANPTSGPTPLTVSFDGTGSSDSDGETLTYAWDLDGDGAYDDSTSASPSRTYSAGSYQVGLRVTDSKGATDTLDEPLRISAGNTPPTATIDTPPSTTAWRVGDRISFSGTASDGEDAALPASALSWDWVVHHCATAETCHEHVWESFPGVASGTFIAPDHEYPSYLELRLTATDSGGLTDTESIRLDPKTVELSFQANHPGLKLVVGGDESTTPFSRTVIAGSKNSLSAPSPQSLAAGTSYQFASWSDGGAQSHDIVAPDAASATYTATYTPNTDSTPPQTTMVSGPSGYIKSTSASFSFSSEIGSTFQCRRDASTFSTCTSPKSYSSLSQGNHTFHVRAIDTNGNIDTSPASRSWFVDTVVPSGTISINGGAPSTSSRSVTLRLSGSDPPAASGVSSMRLRNEGTSTWSGWFEYSTSKPWTLSVGGGTKTVYVKYRDHAGNISTAASDKITFRP